MEAFFFGPSSEYLFGTYHPPQNTDKREGVVICAPYGQEYMRAHRSLRRLAINLAKQGYSVLRFDYRGTGDSSGSLLDVTADDWQQDIELAVQELVDISAVPKVTLLGLRVGALVAAPVAVAHRQVHRLMMWDPVVCGQEYIDELSQEISKKNKSRSKFIAPEGTLHFNGFAMSNAFQESLIGLDLLSMDALSSLSVAEYVSHETDIFFTLKNRLEKSNSFTYQYEEAPHNWNYVDHVGGLMWPQMILDAIENYFS